MKNISHILFVFTFVCFSSPLHSMKRTMDDVKTMQETTILDLPRELLTCIAGNCKPKEKNRFMKVCKAFNICGKDRASIVCVNPCTVHWSDKKKSMFEFARLGNIAVIECLLKVAKMDVDMKDCLGMTPLHYAMEKNHQGVVQFLVQYKANVHECKPYIYPIHDAVFKGDIEYVKSLLAVNVDLDVALENDATPLSIAIHEGHTEIEQLLRDAGAEELQEDRGLNFMLRPITANRFREIVRRNNTV